MTENNQNPDSIGGQEGKPGQDEPVRFAEEAQPEAAAKGQACWKILVVDDDSAVHAVTRLTLRDFRFDGRPLEIRDAYSGEEAVAIMRREPDIALILMDVVMESESAGLEAVDAIRKQLGNNRTRIILRTGQPGQAPEDAVTRKFGINDYKDKTELTAAKLKTLICARLKDYQALAGADESAARIDNLEQLIHLLRREQSGLEVLDRLSGELQACTSLAELGGLVASGARALTGASAGMVLFFGEDGRALQPAEAWGGFDRCALTGDTDCPILHRWKSSRHGEQGQAGAACERLGPGLPHVCIPITSEDQVRGVLLIVGQDLREGDAAPPLLRTLALRTGLIAENLLLHQRLHALSVRDGLTGLFNRRFMTETLSIEQSRAKRGGTVFALAFFDLDHFKAVNDNHGHQAGDAALIAFAGVLQQHIRSGDVACRYGGEEFAVIMPGTSGAAALERAEVIRQSWAETAVSPGLLTLPPLTVSVGVAAFPDNAESPDELLRAADEALYRAKHKGRNRCEEAIRRTKP